MSKKTYLITGASGFIGSCLFRKLAKQNASISLILRKQTKLWRIKDILPKATVYISDLSNAQKLKKIVAKAKPTIIYHLAAYGAYPCQNDPKKNIQTNILGTWNLLQALTHREYELFVNTGSSSEYGFKKLPMRETDTLKPASYYAVTKCSQTLLCSHIAREQRRPIITLRPFSVYGPYEKPTRFIPALLKSLYLGEKISLVSPGFSHDQIFIDDVIKAYLLIDKLKKYGGEVLNIGTGVQSSIKDVVETAVKVTGKTTDFKWGETKPRIWDATTWVADVSKAKRLLGWSPEVSLERGLSLTWEWFKTNHYFYTGRLS
ncbi:MAG: NAD-dependent epimerase/dehydratase family protein [Candidatus Omnitrophota bacterium]